MKKQKKQLLWMVLVLLLLVGGYFGVQKYNQAQAEKETEDDSLYALNVDSSEVTELSYTYEGVEYAFVLEDDVWKYRDDETLNLIQSRLNTMAEKLASLAVESQIDNVTDLSVYGLEEPEKVITFLAGGISYKIAVGDYNSMSGMDYININDSNVVYAVETTFGNAFDYILEELVEEVEEETESTTESSTNTQETNE